jgi:hypothetical protein
LAVGGCFLENMHHARIDLSRKAERCGWDRVSRVDPEGIAGAEFVASPDEPSDQSFDRIGSASRTFTRYFATRTVDGDHLIQLNGAPVPEWFAPLAVWDFKRSRLPLWLFHQQPSTAALKTTADPDEEQGQRASTGDDA